MVLHVLLSWQVQVLVPRHLATLAWAPRRGCRTTDQVHRLQTRRVQVREVSEQETTIWSLPCYQNVLCTGLHSSAPSFLGTYVDLPADASIYSVWMQLSKVRRKRWTSKGALGSTPAWAAGMSLCLQSEEAARVDLTSEYIDSSVVQMYEWPPRDPRTYMMWHWL
jgi:hypothetical protein